MPPSQVTVTAELLHGLLRFPKLTSSYQVLERTEGEQCERRMLGDGQTHLVLIREEAGVPDTKLSGWVDAMIFVFRLEDESSFQADRISASSPPMVGDARAQTLHTDVGRCSYGETYAACRLDAGPVFREVVQKVVTLLRWRQLLAASKSLPSSLLLL
ncbi:hypothetical protein ACRRTK_016162 [Alexandromys fortis]